MTDILVSLRKITITLVFLLFTVLMILMANAYHIKSIFNIYNTLIYGGFIILFVLLIRELLNKKGLYSDILFNGAYVVSMVYILIVMLRNMLDPYIIMNSTPEGGMTFFNYNFIFILMIVMGLIIYNILMMIGDKRK